MYYLKVPATSDRVGLVISLPRECEGDYSRLKYDQICHIWLYSILKYRILSIKDKIYIALYLWRKKYWYSAPLDRIIWEIGGWPENGIYSWISSGDWTSVMGWGGLSWDQFLCLENLQYSELQQFFFLFLMADLLPLCCDCIIDHIFKIAEHSQLLICVLYGKEGLDVFFMNWNWLMEN